MKHNIYSLAAFIAFMGLVITGCSTDTDAPFKEKQLLRFKTELSTRGMSFEDFPNMPLYVSAYCDSVLFLNNEEFKRDSAGFFSSATNTYYLPEEGKKLDLYCYWPSPALIAKYCGPDAKVVFNSEERKVHNFHVPSAIEDQIDFIASKKCGIVGEEDFSTFYLLRGLNSLKIYASNTTKDCVIKVAGIKMGGFISTGTFDFETMNWTLKSDEKPSVYTSIFDEVEICKTDKGSDNRTSFGNNGTIFFIPQETKVWNPEADPTNAEGGSYISMLVQVCDEATGKLIYPVSDVSSPEKPGFAWLAFPLHRYMFTKYTYHIIFEGVAGYTDPQSANPGVPVAKTESNVKIVAK